MLSKPNKIKNYIYIMIPIFFVSVSLIIAFVTLFYTHTPYCKLIHQNIDSYILWA